MAVAGAFVNAKETRQLAPGEVVFSEGDAGSEMYGVISGSVELRHGDTVVTTIGPDGTFGELSIIDQSDRSLTAVAAERRRSPSSTSARSCSSCTRRRPSRSR